MVADTVAELGRVDILVNNAGTVVRKTPDQTSTEEWDLVLDVNLRASFPGGPRGLSPHERTGRRQDNRHRVHVLDISAEAAAALPYSASKGGVVQLAKSLAVAWGQRQHPVKCHTARLVHDYPDFGHTGEPAGTVPDDQQPDTHGPLGRSGRVAGNGGVPVQQGVGLRDGSGDYSGRGFLGDVERDRRYRPGSLERAQRNGKGRIAMRPCRMRVIWKWGNADSALVRRR